MVAREKYMNTYFVYTIKSQIDGRLYVGMSENLKKRLTEHNKGQTKSTKAYRPWVLVYKKYVGSRKEARKEEKKLKSGSGKEFLKKYSAVAQW